MSVPAMLLLLGAVQGLFLALLLIRKRRGHPADRWLAALMAAYSIGLVTIELGMTGGYNRVPHLVGTTTAVPFLYGPLHYLYVRRRLSHGHRFQRIDFAHFLPFVTYVAYLIPFFLESAAYKQSFFEQMMAGSAPPVIAVMSAFKAVHGTAYLFVAWTLLVRQTNAGATAAGVTEPFLTWLRRFTALTLLVWIIHLLLLGLDLSGIDGLNVVDAVTGIVMAVVIYSIGYLGLREHGIFTDAHERATTSKYERSGLNDAESSALASRLLDHLEKNRPFVEEDFSLQTLAADLNASPHHVSQVINEHLGRTFFDLVNEFRIELACRILKDPDYAHWTMLAIAQEVGFSSRSTFNKAFKKHTGMTPSRYREG